MDPTRRALVALALSAISFTQLRACFSTCDAASCPDGCCSAGYMCDSGTSWAACGKGGAECMLCGDLDECVDQACVPKGECGQRSSQCDAAHPCCAGLGCRAYAEGANLQRCIPCGEDAGFCVDDYQCCPGERCVQLDEVNRGCR